MITQSKRKMLSATLGVAVLSSSVLGYSLEQPKESNQQLKSPALKKDNDYVIKTTDGALQFNTTTSAALNVSMPYGYISDNYEKMAYCYNEEWNLDIRGVFDGKWKRTTFYDEGFYTYYKTDDGTKFVAADGTSNVVDRVNNISIKIEPVFRNNGETIQFKYTVVNEGDAAVTYSLGSSADVQIGEDDAARITELEGNKGFKLVSGEEDDKNEAGEYAQFNFFAKDTPGVTNVDEFWYGRYSDWSDDQQAYTFYTYEQRHVSTSTYDSAMAFSWQDRIIEPGATQVYTVLLGIGGAGSEDIASSFTVAFNTDGGSEIAPITDIAPDTTITLPANPTKEGSTFAGWYTAPNGQGSLFDASTPITESMTLYAYWIEESLQPNSNYQAIKLVGFNHDIIANGSDSSNSDALQSVTTAFDRPNTNNESYGLFAKDFRGPFNPDTAPEGGLTSTSLVGTNNVAYELEAFDQNNALLLTGDESGTLTLVQSGVYESLSILASSASQAASFNVTLNFSDGSTQEGISFAVPDWYDNSSNTAIVQDIFRVKTATTADNQAGYIEGVYGPYLFDCPIVIVPDNRGKLLESITFNKNQGNGRTGIFAISAQKPEDAPNAPTGLTTHTITNNTFTTSWETVTDAEGYYLDVATDANFTSLLPLYNNKYIGNVNQYTVTGLDKNTSYYYRLRAENTAGVSFNSGVVSLTTGNEVGNTGDSNDSGNSTNTSTQKPSITINGSKDESSKITINNNEMTIVLDSEALADRIAAADNNTSIVIDANANIDKTTVSLNLNNVEAMAKKQMDMSVKADSITYTLPAEALDVTGIQSELGDTNSDAIKINVIVNEQSKAARNKFDVLAEKEGFQIIQQPFSVNVVATHNDKTMDVKNLNKYVSVSIPISKEEAQKITTALIIEEDGSSYHVPTTVYQENGKYYARVKSLSNGDFALVYNEANYSDVTGKWYEDLVNEMSSRKITDGVESEKFEGDKAITRGEFAGFLVNALGLPQRTQIQNRFEDVDATEWYTNHIATAYKYGIVKGVNASETLYGPNNTITRQEAMAMIARASQVAEFEGTSQGNVGGFTDATKVSDWALEAVGFNVANQLIIGDNNKLRPRDSISRAESLAMMLRLLQKAELVDVRTQN